MDTPEKKACFKAPDNDYGLMAYHTHDGYPLDEDKMRDFINKSAGPAMEAAEEYYFGDKPDLSVPSKSENKQIKKLDAKPDEDCQLCNGSGLMTPLSSDGSRVVQCVCVEYI